MEVVLEVAQAKVLGWRELRDGCACPNGVHYSEVPLYVLASGLRMRHALRTVRVPSQGCSSTDSTGSPFS